MTDYSRYPKGWRKNDGTLSDTEWFHIADQYLLSTFSILSTLQINEFKQYRFRRRLTDDANCKRSRPHLLGTNKTISMPFVTLISLQNSFQYLQRLRLRKSMPIDRSVSNLFYSPRAINRFLPNLIEFSNMCMDVSGVKHICLLDSHRYANPQSDHGLKYLSICQWSSYWWGQYVSTVTSLLPACGWWGMHVWTPKVQDFRDISLDHVV